MNKKITDDSIIKDISLRKMMDVRTVRLIVNYPLKFLKDKMQNMTDWRPVRIRYFGVFGLTKAGRDQWGNKDEQTSKEAFEKIRKPEKSNTKLSIQN